MQAADTSTGIVPVMNGAVAVSGSFTLTDRDSSVINRSGLIFAFT